MTANQSSASLVSRLFAFLLPLVLATYWPLFGTGQAVHAGVLVIRFTLLAGVAILSLLWVQGRVTPTESRWIKLFAGYLCILLIASLVSSDVSRSLHNWLRVLAVYCVAIALARPLRNKGTQQAFGIALAVAGLLSLLFIFAIYFYDAGLSLPTYDHIREFKAHVQHASGIALNPLASATLMFCVLSLCLLRSGWVQRSLAVLVAILSSAFTGSRAPLALALGGLAALYITNLFHKRALVNRAFAWTASILLVVAGILGLLLVDPVQLSAVTEGRYDVWTVGVEKFLERPLVGYGAESWRDDLASRLPGYYTGTSGLARLRSGGYHSEFVTLLAEGGLLCFIPAMFIFGMLFRTCCRIAYRTATPRFNGQAILFTFFLVFFRAAVEVPGVFGSGEDVTDYLAAMFVAIVISRAALLEKRAPVSRRSGTRDLAQGPPVLSSAFAKA